MKMRIFGEVALHRAVNGRWYVVEQSLVELDELRVLCRPEGYGSHREASRWRDRYRAVGSFQRVGRRASSY